MYVFVIAQPVRRQGTKHGGLLANTSAGKLHSATHGGGEDVTVNASTLGGGAGVSSVVHVSQPTAGEQTVK